MLRDMMAIAYAAAGIMPEHVYAYADEAIATKHDEKREHKLRAESVAVAEELRAALTLVSRCHRKCTTCREHINTVLNGYAAWSAS